MLCTHNGKTHVKIEMRSEKKIIYVQYVIHAEYRDKVISILSAFRFIIAISNSSYSYMSLFLTHRTFYK